MPEFRNSNLNFGCLLKKPEDEQGSEGPPLRGVISIQMCLCVIDVDLIEPFCRFQLKKERTACCFELRVLVWFWVDFYHKC